MDDHSSDHCGLACAGEENPPRHFDCAVRDTKINSLIIIVPGLAQYQERGGREKCVCVLKKRKKAES